MKSDVFQEKEREGRNTMQRKREREKKREEKIRAAEKKMGGGVRVYRGRGVVEGRSLRGPGGQTAAGG